MDRIGCVKEVGLQVIVWNALQALTLSHLNAQRCIAHKGIII